MARRTEQIFLLLALFVGVSLATEHTFDLKVTWKWLNPDGYWRNVFAINDQFPGPVLNVTEGDTVIVKVTNLVPRDSISMHYHGLSMRGTPEMDGAAGFTQLPIPPLQSFEYRFVAQDPGTHWYHAHMALQYCDGMYGAFIVNKKNDPLRALYDEEIPIILSDWFHADGVSLGTARPDEHHWLPFPLINGRGQTDCVNGEHGFTRWCEPIPPTEFVVKPGMRYRLRIIGAMSRVGFKFAVSNHMLKVVSRQGFDVEPFDTNEIQLFMGDRYDVILSAKQDIGEYKVRVQVTGCDNCTADGKNNQPNLGYISWATVRYENAVKGSAKEFQYANQLGENLPEETTVYNDARIKPRDPIVVPPANKFWTLNMTSQRFFEPNDVSPHRKWYFNGKLFHGMMTSTPLLFRVLLGETFTPEKDLIFTAEYGDVIDFVFNAQHNQDHPMHMHGYKFFVLGHGKGDFDGDMSKLNLVNPPYLDTMNVEGNSWLYLRIVADNPGAWIMHCHLDFHHREEMAFAWVIAPDRLRASMKMPELPMCDTYSKLVSKYGEQTGSDHLRGNDSNAYAIIGLIIVGAFIILVGIAVYVWRRRVVEKQKLNARLQAEMDSLGLQEDDE